MKLIRKLIKLLLLLLLILLVCLVGFMYWASRGFDSEAPAQEPETIAELASDAPTTAPQVLRVVTYNIHHAMGNEGEFGVPSVEEQFGYLEAMTELLEAQDADIVALQEVDFAGKRSHDIDQLDHLANALGYPYRARITTWRKNYVPFPYWPLSGHIGPIHSGQVVMSRYPIVSNQRIVLPQPDSNAWYYNAFYLNRSLQIVEVEVGDRTIAVYNCHLEAFDARNREQQAAILIARVMTSDAEDWIVLGDMNALPPEAPQFKDFADEPDWDGTNDKTIEILREGLSVMETPADYEADQAFTFPAAAPTRRLDYIFSSATLPSVDAAVMSQASQISDHLPVVAGLRMGPASASELE